MTSFNSKNPQWLHKHRFIPQTQVIYPVSVIPLINKRKNKNTKITFTTVNEFIPSRGVCERLERSQAAWKAASLAADADLSALISNSSPLFLSCSSGASSTFLLENRSWSTKSSPFGLRFNAGRGCSLTVLPFHWESLLATLDENHHLSTTGQHLP